MPNKDRMRWYVLIDAMIKDFITKLFFCGPLLDDV